MNQFSFSISIFAAIACLFVDSTVRADDRGTITFQCKGEAQHNNSPLGRNSSITYSHQEGTAVIDFEQRKFQFSDWGWVPLTRVDADHLSAKLGTFENDTHLANIELNRLTGETYVQYWVHDHHRKIFWYRHIFAGKCEQP